MTPEQESRIRFDILMVIALVIGVGAGLAIGININHDQILDTLCRMDYPECVMGVDR